MSGKNYYDTSILKFKDSIYYFKRIYEENEESSAYSELHSGLKSRNSTQYEGGSISG